MREPKFLWTLDPRPIQGEVGLRARLEISCMLALVATAAVMHLSLMPWGLGIGDEGYLASGVQRILAGEVLYRDFLRVYAPGIYYLHLPLFRMLGPDLLLTRITSVFMLAILAALTFWVLRPWTPRLAAFGAGLLPILVPPPSHKVFVPLMAMIGLAICKALATTSPSPRLLFLAGAGVGFVALFRQEVAAYTLLIALSTIAAVLAQEESGNPMTTGLLPKIPKRVAPLAIGVSTVCLPIGLAFAYQGALLAMIEQITLGGLRVNSGMSLPFPRLFGSTPWFTQSLFYFPAAAAISGFVVVGTRLSRRRFDAPTLVLAQWSIMTVLIHSQVLQRSDMAHLKQVLVLPALILAHLVSNAWTSRIPSSDRAARWVRRIACLPIVIWCIFVFYWGYETNHQLIRKALAHGQTLGEPRAEVVLPPPFASSFSSMLSSVRELTEPYEPIFVAPYAPIVYFLTDRPNPTRYDLVFPGSSSSADIQDEIIARLEASSVRLVLIQDFSWDGQEERRFPKYAPIFAHYLNRTFVQHEKIGTWVIYLRRSP